MNAREVKDKMTVLIGGKPAKDLPVAIGQDGVVASRLSQTESPSEDFRRKVDESGRREEQHRAEKEKATRLKELASKAQAREQAELNGNNSAEIIAGFQQHEKDADREIQIEKDAQFNLFSAERERIRASRHAVWLELYANMIAPLYSQISETIASEKPELAFIDNVLSEHSQARKDIVRVDTEIDSFNQLAKDNKMAGNLFIPGTEKLSGSYEAEVDKTLSLALRRVETTIKKISSAFKAKAAAAAARAKELERHQRSSGWIPGK
ncbi:MAG TPA: hypothetical protein VN881_09475 [Candidatus Acidoferrales bacterium]|nr:hypothetical protein [Candidatus Acidoferrales bacterium]